jgi:hypothetical protein
MDSAGWDAAGSEAAGAEAGAAEVAAVGAGEEVPPPQAARRRMADAASAMTFSRGRRVMQVSVRSNHACSVISQIRPIK